MAGHSKWSKIRHQKAANDAKKGKIFSKLAQQIAIAARDGGGDPDANFSLRLLIDKARAASMPADNVKRAIDRGTGKSGEVLNLEHAQYEGFGPDGVSIIVDTLTDNKNRTVADLRKLFSESNGNLGDAGSVSWDFTQGGLVTVKPARMEPSDKFGQDDKEVEVDKEEVMLALMEVDGVMDISTTSNSNDKHSTINDSVVEEVKAEGEGGVGYALFEVYTDPKMLAAVRDSIAGLGYLVKSADLVWIPNNSKEIEDWSKVGAFIDKLEEMDEVQSVFTNVA